MEFKIIDRMPETFLFFGFENYKEVEWTKGSICPWAALWDFETYVNWEMRTKQILSAKKQKNCEKIAKKYRWTAVERFSHSGKRHSSKPNKIFMTSAKMSVVRRINYCLVFSTSFLNIYIIFITKSAKKFGREKGETRAHTSVKKRAETRGDRTIEPSVARRSKLIKNPYRESLRTAKLSSRLNPGLRARSAWVTSKDASARRARRCVFC